MDRPARLAASLLGVPPRPAPTPGLLLLPAPAANQLPLPPMKRLFLFSAVLGLLAARVEAKSQLLYPITVGKFENHSNYAGPLDLPAAFRAELTTLLDGTNLFTVVPEAETPGDPTAGAMAP